jgi:prolipoprotein diacylglyceryl transferase
MMTVYSLFITWNVDPELFRIGGVGLRYYSLLFALAFLLGVALMHQLYRREGVAEDLVNPLLVYVLLGTLIGARLGQSLFYEWAYFKHHPLEIILPFRIRPEGWEWTGFQGLASHGGALGILAAVALYARNYQQSFLWVTDRLVIVVALGGFFIRLGNLFNSEIIGKPTEVPWAFVFERVDPLPRHPSQLYEALAYGLIFWVLWRVHQHHRTKRGFLLGLFLLGVFSARFLIEFTKEVQVDFESAWWLNMGQVLSIPFIGAGVYFVGRTGRTKQGPGE